MTEESKWAIADTAEMIVSGYAFLRKANYILIVNLNQKESHTMLISQQGQVLNSNMAPTEQAIVLKIWAKDAQFMDEENEEKLISIR